MYTHMYIDMHTKNTYTCTHTSTHVRSILSGDFNLVD